jgi:hypothetical protein
MLWVLLSGYAWYSIAWNPNQAKRTDCLEKGRGVYDTALYGQKVLVVEKTTWMSRC